MWNTNTVVLIVESVNALLFFGVLIRLWKKIDLPDAALWTLVWCTRVFASINGSLHIPPGSVEAGVYLGLQSCSAWALTLIVGRSELRVLKERLLRNLFVQVVAKSDCPLTVARER